MPFGQSRPELYDFLAPAQGPDEIGRLGPYRVLKVLGAGGMGVVFEAEDLQLKRRVALKALRPTLAASDSGRQRFLREAQLAAGIEHDHIIPIFQVGEDRGVPFLAMPLLQGESLEDRLKRQKRQSVAEILRIGREIAQGLAAAHRNGLIHRDIKPANVWLETLPGEPEASSPGERGVSTPRYRIKILDFGLARPAGNASCLSQQGAIVGTPAYMAPEQVEGRSVDERCDLFSLGCVLYILCTGTSPFQREDIVASLLAVASHKPPPPTELNRQVPPALSDLVMAMLAKDPAQRPPSAAAVVAAIQAIEQGEPEPNPHYRVRERGVTRDIPWPGEVGDPKEPAKGIPAPLVPRRTSRGEKRFRVRFWVLSALLALGVLIAGMMWPDLSRRTPESERPTVARPRKRPEVKKDSSQPKQAKDKTREKKPAPPAIAASPTYRSLLDEARKQPNTRLGNEKGLGLYEQILHRVLRKKKLRLEPKHHLDDEISAGLVKLVTYKQKLTIDPKPLSDSVLQPALQVIKRLPRTADLKERQAALLAKQGLLLHDYPQAYSADVSNFARSTRTATWKHLPSC